MAGPGRQSTCALQVPKTESPALPVPVPAAPAAAASLTEDYLPDLGLGDLLKEVSLCACCYYSTQVTEGRFLLMLEGQCLLPRWLKAVGAGDGASALGFDFRVPTVRSATSACSESMSKGARPRMVCSMGEKASPSVRLRVSGAQNGMSTR